MRNTRQLRLLIAIVLAAASVRPFVAQVYSPVVRKNTTANQHYFDRGSPEYPKFLARVAGATPENARVAIFVPMRRWDDGYAYAYYRASYFLPGREVLPVVWRDDRLIPGNVESADYIAAWKLSVGAKGFVPVWTAHGGTLYRRVR